MEHREPPRIVAGDRRFRGVRGEARGRIPAAHVRPVQQATARCGSVGNGVARCPGCGGRLLYLASRATRARGWLAASPASLSACVRRDSVGQRTSALVSGWKTRVLRAGAAELGKPERISLLGSDPSDLAMAFKLDPWVEEVIKVAYAPGRIVVELELPRAGCVGEVGGGSQQIIDDEGRVLPRTTWTSKSSVHCSRSPARDSSAPSDSRPGVVWKSRVDNGEVRAS